MLDVAAGGGRHARWLAARGHRVTAVDRDAAAMAALAAVVEASSPTSKTAPWPLAGRTLRRRRRHELPLAAAPAGAGRRRSRPAACCSTRPSPPATRPSAGRRARLSARATVNFSRPARVCASSPTKTASSPTPTRFVQRIAAVRERGAEPSRTLRRSSPAATTGAARIDRLRTPHMKPITGSIVALVTPMHDDGSIDYRRVAQPDRLAHRRRHAMPRASSARPASRRPSPSRSTARSSASPSSTRAAACR